jgi:hypothetical protein
MAINGTSDTYIKFEGGAVRGGGCRIMGVRE